MPSPALPRRLRAAGALTAGLALLAVTACGTPAEEETASGSSGYEVTVTTPDDGEVTLTTEPRRIAALNGNRVVPFLLPFLDEDHQLVGYGNEIDPADFPWITEALDGLPVSPDLEGPSPETYLSWDPDLMIANGNLGDYWAPAGAVGPLVQLPETDWRATVTLLGEIFEEPDVAEQTIAEAEKQIEAAVLDEPVTAAVLSPYQDNGTVGLQVLGAELPNFLTDLGIEVAASDTAMDGYEDVSLEVLAERLDVDWVIVVNNGDELQESLLADPLVSQIPVIAEGRVVRFDAQSSAAGFPVTPPTIPVLIDALDPILTP